MAAVMESASPPVYGLSDNPLRKLGTIRPRDCILSAAARIPSVMG